MFNIPLHKLTGFNLLELPLEGHVRTLIDSIDNQDGFKLAFLFLFHGKRNYSVLNFIKNENFYSLFIHNYFPIISCPIITENLFDRTKPMQLVFKYQEVPEEIEKLVEPQFSCVSVDYLNSELRKEDLVGFDDSVLERVHNFKPQTIGDVMFNYWD